MDRRNSMTGYHLVRKRMLVGVLSAAFASTTVSSLTAQNRTVSIADMGSSSKSGSSKATGVPLPASFPQDTTVVLDKHMYDLARPADLTDFLGSVNRLLALSKEEKSEKKAAKKADKKADNKAGKEAAANSEDKKSAERETDTQRDAGTGKSAVTKPKDDLAKRKEADSVEGAEADETESGKARNGERDWSSGKVKKGLKAVAKVASELQTGKLDTTSAVREIQEICWAIESNFISQYVWRDSVDLGDAVFHTRYLMLNSVGRGSSSRPAWNLRSYSSGDLSTIDPKVSTFWSRPSSIAEEDLFTPYGRKANLDLADSICTYESPHKGYGIHPSFEVNWHDETWKVKFDEEQSSGPFASRLFWALGFPVDVYDFAPVVKIRWDKRIVTMFNSRKLVSTHVKLFHIPITTVHPDRYFDPFQYIDYAVLKDGSRVSADQLRERCFPAVPGAAKPAHPELVSGLYNDEFGNTIDYVVMNNASYTTKDPPDDVTEIGYWDYNALDHANLREVRGMGVLNAWLDNWDTRWANNRLYITDEKKGGVGIKSVVSDLGALFGNSDGLVRKVNGRLKVGVYQNVPNDFSWNFTHSQAPGKSAVPISHYMPVTKVNSFYNMNLDDARWMARLIAQLTEPQIRSALIGAGYEAPVAKLILEKLVARRDQMVRDFGLSNEIRPLRDRGIDKHFSYDPRKDGSFDVTTPDGTKHIARDTGKYIVRQGALVTLPVRQEPLSRPLSRYSSTAPYPDSTAASP